MLARKVSLSIRPAANVITPVDHDRKRHSSFIRSLIAVLRARLELRAATAQLHALDQRMLKDIGLDRSEIVSVLTDRTGERRIGARSLLSIDRPALDRQHSNPIKEEVVTIKTLAVSIFIFAAAIILVAGLTNASPDTPRLGACSFTDNDRSADPSAIMRRAPRELRVEDYPLH